MVDGFHQPRLRSENTGVQDTSSRGDDLATTAMDGISMESYVIKIEPDSSHVLVTENSLETHKIVNLSNQRLVLQSWFELLYG